MTEFQITKLIANQSVYYPKPFLLGSVEIKNNKFDLPEEKDILQQSLIKNKEEINLEFSIRLTTIIATEGNSENDAIEEADKHFEEILDVLSKEGFISRFELKKSGFIKNLATNEMKPIISSDILVKPSMAFSVDGERFPGIQLNEYIYYNKKHTLNQRYLNSLHWSRLSQWENNYQLKILFNWFAIESLIKIDENDDIVTKIMLAIGLPIGEKCKEFNSDFLDKLMSYPNYRSIRANILNEINDIRDFRNKSVHLGYRKFDIDKKMIKKYSYLINNGKVCLFSLADSGIINKIENEIELWQNAAFLFQENKNSINHCHNNFLFSYTNGHFF